MYVQVLENQYSKAGVDDGGTLILKVLSSEMDPAEIRFIR
jgi:hypothetical protein